MNPRDLVVSDGELADLADQLARVADIAMNLAIAATGHQSRGDGPGRSAPASRPPYNVGAQQALDDLCNELGTTVRHICEYRAMPVPDSCSTILGQATWLRHNRIAIGVMSDGREIYDRLDKAITRAARAAGEVERENRFIDKAMVEEANRQVVTGRQVERLAHKLGDQAKGITERRVKYLRTKGFLTGTQDPETQTWFYRLGDVLAAHRRARVEKTRPRVSA